MSDFSPDYFNQDPFEQVEEQLNTQATTANNQLPCAIDAEKALLGKLLLNGEELFSTVQSVLNAEHFFSQPHREIFKTLEKLDEKNTPFDPITVCELLTRTKTLGKAGGQPYIMELATNGVFNSNLDNLSNIIYERAALREIIQASKSVIADSYSDEALDSTSLLEKADQRLQNIREKRPLSGGLKAIDHILEDTFERLTEIRANKNNLTGITTGFAKLNEKTSGWQKSDLIVLAARPSMGKTALALNFLEHAARTKKNTLLFSLEMPAVAIAMRMIAALSQTPLTDIREAKLNTEQWKNVGLAIAKLKSFNLSIDDTSGLSVAQMRDRIRRYARESGSPGLIVVDYLGLMHSPHHKDNRVQEISQISGGLKQIARDYQCPVIALSQLSRNVEQRNNKKPILADLRDSGSIEQDADLILFIYRDEYYHKENSKRKGIADLIIAKHRNGEIGEVALKFEPTLTQFSNLTYTENVDSFAASD